MHCSSPAPMASLWLATALMKTKMEDGSRDLKCKYALYIALLNISYLSHLVVTMDPKLCMDFLSPSVSITKSS